MTRLERGFGEVLREHRGEMTQQRLGDRAGIHVSTISRFETGNDGPSILQVNSMADVLGASRLELLEQSGHLVIEIEDAELKEKVKEVLKMLFDGRMVELR